MTTLGALSVGLLVLVLIVAAAIALLARSQRRAPRGPEQPRTVADLVRIREAEAQARAAAGPEAPPASEAPTESFAPTAVAAAGRASGSDVAGSPPAGESPELDQGADRPGAPAAAVEAPQPAPDPAPSGSASVQDTPWGRAARMADPLGEWTASARAARGHEGTSVPGRAAGGVPEAPTPEKDPAVPPPPRLSLLSPDRPALTHDTTTIAHLPRGFAQAAKSTGPAAPTPSAPSEPEAAEPEAAEPEAAEPEVAEAEVAEAEVAEAEAVEAEAVEAEAAESPVAQPPAAEPPGEAPDEPTAPAEAAAPVGVVAEAAIPCPIVGNGVPFTNGHAIAAAPSNGAPPIPTPARVAGRVRRSPTDTAAEQAAADLALLRTFGVAGPGRTAAADDTEVELEGCSTDDAVPSAGTAQPVTFRVVGRDGRGLPGASVTLLDDHGQEISGTTADENGAGILTTRRPGGYMLVTAAHGYQPGAVTIAVAEAPVDTEIPLTRSGSIAGSVCGEDGPVVGAHLVLVQDGEIVDTADSSADGAYVFADLAAGEYGLSVTASECEPTAAVLRLADEADLRYDVDLDPVGLPAGDVADDVMIGHL